MLVVRIAMQTIRKLIKRLSKEESLQRNHQKKLSQETRFLVSPRRHPINFRVD